MLNTDELVRYSRHLRLPQFGETGQTKLKNARVLVIGMGGLGSPVSLYLAAAGIGTLGLADFDAVELHNLQRQILHTNDAIGSPKLDSAERALLAINPSLKIERHPQGVQAENAVELIGQYDVVVDGTDNFPTRYLVNDACYLAKTPLAYGSIFQFEGQISFFHPHGGGPCYRCLFPKMPEPGSIPNCDEAGVLGALCGVVGSLQALEAIKHIAGIGQSLSGRLLVVDTLSMRMRTLNLKADPDCPLCGKSPSITAIDPANYNWSCQTDDSAEPSTKTQAHDAMNDSDSLPMELHIDEARALKNAVFLDVREAFETQICSIPEARHIPLGNVPEQYSGLPKDVPLVVYCHHGGRSLRATQYLRSVGFDNATNMRGGIDQWAAQVDPSMPRY